MSTCEPGWKREFEEECYCSKRHPIRIMGIILKLFLWRMITLTLLCEGVINRVLYVVIAHANMNAWHGIFQLLDGVAFSSRQPLFTNEIRPMKPAMGRVRRSYPPLTLL
ncbi:conserved hypothetical protein [Trichinella spiralis]|uniref:hypothetical protein n=1 Tax=Trichinella spiralis TaxID=6334 RepID=UPI0001EFE291|nr:conserved hypothetical protein [Trichinella spiralis]